MDKRKFEVMQRRQALLAEISGQREHLAELATRWQPALRMADQAVVAVNFLRVHPVLLAGLAGLLVVRRNGLSGLVKGVWRIVKAYRYVNDFSKKMTSRL
ncbi:MAG: YqjK family protein [Gallionella sp.]|nr:YqjK family protein [Gallionella sp.]